MSAADESENLLDHLTERISPNGRRVISNPTRQPEPRGDELRALIQSMQQGWVSPGWRKVDKTEPPAAA
jgi:hypothetical protein